jgi:hypothetical protein
MTHPATVAKHSDKKSTVMSSHLPHVLRKAWAF